jgi:hypothetical protein
MTSVEKRAAIQYHVGECTLLTHEPQTGYGLMKKESIIQHLKRALELAESLDE